MIHSMTAFGRDQSDGDWGTLVWELRSVNHRYLDISFRLPEDLKLLEAEVRKRLGKSLSRGKVDCSLRFQGAVQARTEFPVNQSMVGGLLRAAETIQSLGDGIPSMTATEVLQWPGVLESPEIDIEALGATALAGLERALKELVQTRAREGAGLADFLKQRLAAMETLVTDTGEIMPEVLETFRQRLSHRLQEVAGQLDADRLEQEMVLFAGKIDVAEELDRLSAHAAEVRRILDKGGAVGRRLDFLMQEFNREANTLGAKASDIRITNTSVELKVLIEQMREQAQNIE